MSTKKEMETEAQHTARTQIDSILEFTKVNNIYDTKPQVERLQWFLVWAKKNLHYNETEGKHVFEQERLKKIDELAEQSLKHLKEISQHWQAVCETSWRLFEKNFVVVTTDDKKTHKFGERPDLTGPTLLESIKELYPYIPDEIALTDPPKYVADLTQRLKGPPIALSDDFIFQLEFRPQI